MGKSRKISALLKHSSLNKTETNRSKNKNSDFQETLKKRKFKKKKKKSTSKCTKMKDSAQLLQQTSNEGKSKLIKPANSFNLAPDVLRDEKRASSNWEKLSKVLNINTATIPTALPYQVNSIRPQPNCNPANVFPIHYSSTVPYASSIPQPHWPGAVSQGNYHPAHVPRVSYNTGPIAATSHQVVNVCNQISPPPVHQFIYIPPSRPMAVPSLVIPGPSHCAPVYGNVKQQSIWNQPKSPTASVTDKRSQQFKLKNADISKRPVYRPELLTKVIAMDCEMVGVGEGGTDSNLARISIVNSNGECIYDKYVHPLEKITDYRTPVSGIRPGDLKGAETLFTVQKEVSEIMNNRVLVGHALKNDFKVLYISHPRHMIRDTSKFTDFRSICGGRTPSLKKLAKTFLAVDIQSGEHSSVEDAQTAMQLYKMFKKEWESSRHRRTPKIVQKS